MIEDHPIYQHPNRVETPRLLLYPLNFQQLRKFIHPNFSLEEELQLALHPRHLSELLEEIIAEEIVEAVKANPAHYIYYTLWIVIRKEDLTIVGNINCKGKPDYLGEVEIGYETADEFQNKGYMTEAIAGFAGWLQNHQKQVIKLIALTLNDNEASIAVLQKNNFNSFVKANATIRWEKRLR